MPELGRDAIVAAVRSAVEPLRRLEALWFVGGVGELDRKRAEAEALFFDVLQELGGDGVCPG